MEPRFGADLSAVRVHTDSSSVQMNRELGAQAFTHGNDVYFGAGKSPGQNELTAHELTHIIQQTGAVQPKIAVAQSPNSANAEIGIQRACTECAAEQEEQQKTGIIQAKTEIAGFNKNLFKPVNSQQVINLQAKTLDKADSQVLANNNQNELPITKTAVNSLPAKEISSQDAVTENKLESGKSEVSQNIPESKPDKSGETKPAGEVAVSQPETTATTETKPAGEVATSESKATPAPVVSEGQTQQLTQEKTAATPVNNQQQIETGNITATDIQVPDLSQANQGTSLTDMWQQQQAEMKNADHNVAQNIDQNQEPKAALQQALQQAQQKLAAIPQPGTDLPKSESLPQPQVEQIEKPATETPPVTAIPEVQNVAVDVLQVADKPAEVAPVSETAEPAAPQQAEVQPEEKAPAEIQPVAQAEVKETVVPEAKETASQATETAEVQQPETQPKIEEEIKPKGQPIAEDNVAVAPVKEEEVKSGAVVQADLLDNPLDWAKGILTSLQGDASTKKKELTPHELEGEMDIVNSSKREPISEGNYTEKVDLGNGHEWKHKKDGTWCRFSDEPFCFDNIKEKSLSHKALVQELGVKEEQIEYALKELQPEQLRKLHQELDPELFNLLTNPKRDTSIIRNFSKALKLAENDAVARKEIVEILRLTQKGSVSNAQLQQSLSNLVSFMERYQGRISGDFASRFRRAVQKNDPIQAQAELNLAEDILEGKTRLGTNRSIEGLPEKSISGSQTPEYRVTGFNTGNHLVEVKVINKPLSEEAIQRNVKKALSQIKEQAGETMEKGGLIRIDSSSATSQMTAEEIYQAIKGQLLTPDKNGKKVTEIIPNLEVEVMYNDATGNLQKLNIISDNGNIVVAP
jgi:hypothetical protein